MSTLEETLLWQIRVAQLPQPEREYRFALPRRWRFDLAWPSRLLAVEIEGGIWVSGRHTRGAGYEGDLEKYNSATLQGWRLLRFSPKMIRSGAALNALEQVLRQ